MSWLKSWGCGVLWLTCACIAQAASMAVPTDGSGIKVGVPAGFEARASLSADRLAGEIFSSVLTNDEQIAFRVIRVAHDHADINQVIEAIQQRLLDNPRLREVRFNNIERIETQDTIAWAWTAKYEDAAEVSVERQERYVFLEGLHETLVLHLQGPRAWMQQHQAQVLSFAHLIEGFEADPQKEVPFELVRLNQGQ